MFTTHGFAWEGFFRSLQSDITTFIGFLVLVGIVFLIVRWMIARSDIDRQAGHRWASSIAVLVVLLAVVLITWRAASIASINRMPRADIDRTGVYDQMNSITRGK